VGQPVLFAIIQTIFLAMILTRPDGVKHTVRQTNPANDIVMNSLPGKLFIYIILEVAI
jgi:hypothetical protein